MSVLGNWKLTMNTPMGTQTPTIIISEEGEDYKGTMDGPMGTVDLEEISIDGSSFGFKAEVDSPMGKIKLAFKGTVDGDSVSGQFDTPMGPTQFTGDRQS